MWDHVHDMCSEAVKGLTSSFDAEDRHQRVLNFQHAARELNRVASALRVLERYLD